MSSRYSYSLVWGIQQLSTLGGNLNPSYYDWEVCFTFVISVLGLFFFAFFIGNMQMFIQSIGRRSREIEWYMQYRNLPDDLRRQVRRAELFRWTATQGIDEEQIIQNLPEHVQRSIRHFLFEFIKKMVFIVRGKMEVLRMDGSVESTLEEGNVCGEELLAWCMDVADLDRFTKRFATYLRRPRIQGAIRYESSYWRGLAASRISTGMENEEDASRLGLPL
ncbi:hypothetical protein M0R45_004416 [Rubus argutus]|uniref:Ion transport domain-containing protein n=1 Tax=Rubus argutus TaxID=59490 RepID=A0AAW1YJS0_RUBAR